MTPQDRAFTITWWDGLLKDDERMMRWLQKLQQTEYDGFTGNREADEQWGGGNPAVSNVFRVTGDDEKRHSDLLVDLIHKRGGTTVEVQPESLYWTEMDAIITSLETCAAVFHLGEVLAAERFKVLFEHDGTPDDIRAFLEAALPDEEYHARAFKRISSPEAIEIVQRKHVEVLAMLMAPKVAAT